MQGSKFVAIISDAASTGGWETGSALTSVGLLQGRHMITGDHRITPHGGYMISLQGYHMISLQGCHKSHDKSEADDITIVRHVSPML